MKKTLVALAVAAVAATSANAAVVYNQDGTKVEVGGSVRVLLAKESNKRTDLKDDGSRLEFSVEHQLGEGLSAFARGRLKLNGDDSVTTDRAYAGLKLDTVGFLSFGKGATNIDDLGFANYQEKFGGVYKGVEEGKKLIRFTSADWSGFRIGADYVFATNAEKTQQTAAGEVKRPNDNAYALAVYYDQTFGDVGLGFNVGYSHEKSSEFDAAANTFDTEKRRTVLVAGQVTYGPVAFGIDYSESKVKGEDGKYKGLEIGAKYQVTDAVKVYTAYKNEKDADRNKTQRYMLGADYRLHKNVQTFLEIGRERTKDVNGNKETDNKAYLGLRVFF